MALTTLAAVEQFLPMPSGNSDEALLTQLINACSAFFESVCGRIFEQASFTEIRDGKGARSMFVANPPISAVSGVIVGVETIPAAGLPGSGGALTPGYVFDANRIALRGYWFHAGTMNVSLSYTGGYATIPSDLAQACAEQVALRYREIPHFDTASKSIAGETTTFVMADMKPSTKAVIDRYRRRWSL